MGDTNNTNEDTNGTKRGDTNEDTNGANEENTNGANEENTKYTKRAKHTKSGNTNGKHE